MRKRDMRRARRSAGLASGLMLACVAALAQPTGQQPPGAAADLKRQEAEETLRGKRQALIQQPLQAPDAGDQQDLDFKPALSPGVPCLHLDAASWTMAGDEAVPVVKRFPVVAGSLSRISGDLSGACITASDAQRLIRHIEARMRRAGYPLVQVTALRVAQDERLLRVAVRIPVIVRITLETTDGQLAHEVDTLFATLARGDVLNSFAMDQTIENVRAAQGSDLLIRVLQNPDNPEELSLQALHQKGRATAMRFEVGTSSSPDLHNYQTVASFSGYRILSQTDDVRLNLMSTPFDLRSGAGQRSLAFDYNRAHGGWRWGIGFRRTEQRQFLAVGDQPALYQSASSTVDLRTDRVLHRTASTVVRARVAVAKRSTDVRFAGEAIEVQRRRLAQFTKGLNWRFQTRSRYAEIDLAHVASPRWFGAQDNFPVLEPSQAGHPSFRRGYLAASVYSSAAAGQIGGLKLQHELYAQFQYARKPQYAADQLQLGPQGTVRGFAGRVLISGEQGVLVRNDLSIPGCFSGLLICYVAFDAGAITRNLLNEKQEAGLASASLGARWAKGPVYMEVTLTRALWLSSHLGPLRSKPVIAGRLGVNF